MVSPPTDSLPPFVPEEYYWDAKGWHFLGAEDAEDEAIAGSVFAQCFENWTGH